MAITRCLPCALAAVVVAALVAGCSDPASSTAQLADAAGFGGGLDGLVLATTDTSASASQDVALDAVDTAAGNADSGTPPAGDSDETGLGSETEPADLFDSANDTQDPSDGEPEDLFAVLADAEDVLGDSSTIAETAASDAPAGTTDATAGSAEVKTEVAIEVMAEVSDATAAVTDAKGDTADTKGDALPDAKPACSAANCSGPGQLRVAGACTTDCRLPGAAACLPGTVCDVGSEHLGQCVDPSKGCVISNPSEGCALPTGAIVQCGPGTVCDVDPGQCIAALPCTGVVCAGGQCWGVECPCERPPAACEPAPLGQPGDKGTLNDPKFAKCGTLSSCDGGIVDLDFDGQCAAWGATCISGPDYVRQLLPWGEVKQYTGITNLNMGEVAALQGMGGLFGSADSQVAFTYTCCATCGCISTPSSQQGVAWVDQKSGGLPNKIPANTVTSGNGPFGNGALDAGPQGLTWGLDLVLYAGNVGKNGDYHAVDLAGAQKQVVATFAQRVVAAGPFDSARLLVALENGEVWFAPVLGKATKAKLVVKLAKTPTSIARDPWHGRIYAQLSDNTIVSLAADGSDVQPFALAATKGRIAMGPGGWLYHVPAYYGSNGPIVRWELPKKFGKGP